MKRGLPDRIREMRVTLWTLIVPPAMWAGHFLFSYLWASVLCAKSGGFARYPGIFWGGTALALVIIVGAGVVARIQSLGPGDPPPHQKGTDADYLRFIAKSTFLLAGLSLVGVVFTALPVLFIGDCR